MRAPALARPGLTYESYRRALSGVALVCPAEALECDETAQWVKRRGVTVGIRSGSQLMQTLSAGIEPTRMVVHADGAQWAPLRCGARAGVREFVLDSVQQVAILEHCARRREQVLVDVTTDDAEQAVDAACASDRVVLVGLHVELQDGLVAPHRWAAAVYDLMGRMAEIRRRHGIITCRLSVGGALGNAPDRVGAVLADAIEDGCARWHFPRPGVMLTVGDCGRERSGPGLK